MLFTRIFGLLFGFGVENNIRQAAFHICQLVQKLEP